MLDNIDFPSWVEVVEKDGTVFSYIIKGGHLPDKTTFLTPSNFNQQLGYIVYQGGGEIKKHTHLPVERHTVGTSEVLFVMKGLAEIDIYDDSHNLVVTRKLEMGDVLLMVQGGHGFRMIEDTVFLEIKQGPYGGLGEKEHF